MEQLDPSRLRALPGRPTPLGATPGEGGVYFAIFGGPATRVWLAVFQTHDAGSPVWEYELSSERDRVGGVWCVFVEGVAEGALYAYRMNGPDDPRHQYDPKRRLIDPYAKAVVGDIPVGNGKSVVVKQSPARQRTGPGIPLSHTVIYETHVRGVTVDASSESKSPGTYRGLKDKIPYLKELGVTTVELLPIQECGEGVLDRFDPATGDALVNYWGYNPIAFMAPTGRYAAAPETAGQVAEFRDLVDAIHKAGLEIILDVVFNHTAEDRGHKPAL
ncbi:MAG: glycogen debranching enzyme, partial [bacterium]|nr:glycogen debranching enzyme [bacterium]